MIERQEIPQPRFGHTVTPISQNKVLIFGGAIGDTINYNFSNDLFVRNLPTRQWKKVEVIGNKPSPRAAHTTIAIDMPYFLVYGGATGLGEMAADEISLLQLIDDSRAKWSIFKTAGKGPGRRYGHTMTYSKPFAVLFGGNRLKIVDGREVQEVSNDTWILNITTDKISNWIQFDGESPSPRVYHSSAICQSGPANGMIVIFGGRDRTGVALNDTWGFRRHRNGDWDWTKPSTKTGIRLPTPRYQHSSIFVGTLLLVIGGRSNIDREDIMMQVYDTDTMENMWRGFKCERRFRHGSWVYENIIYNYGGFEESITAATDSITSIDLEQIFPEDLWKKLKAVTAPKSPKTPTLHERVAQPHVSQKMFKREEEVDIDESKLTLANYFLEGLCSEKRVKGMGYKKNDYFKLEPSRILQLCEEVTFILSKQPMVLKVKSPLKIYGDIHGQYIDLLQFFQIYGSPIYGNKDADIQGYDYIFLGDFVDRGSQSLETVCLLFAMKLKYPNQVHLIRGNHQDRGVNNAFGFLSQCEDRLGDHGSSVFNAFNQAFDWLPLSAIIEDKIICLHGGIGNTVKYISDIEGIKRPLQVVHAVSSPEQQLIVDILWSDPTENDAETGIHPNIVRDPDGTGHIVKFGPDIVQQFLKKNSLSHIIRAHECVMQGFERFAEGKLITVFSATDYCGKHKNAGAILTLKKNLEILPKLIRPKGMMTWIEDKARPPTPPRWHNSRKFS